MAAIDDPALYFNRELSWLDFNQRVLELAEDPEVPLLERLRFCAIYASNLDEFFMVRVAGLFDQLDAGIDARGPDGLAPGEQIDAIQARVLELDRRLHTLLRRRRCGRRWRSTGSGSSRWRPPARRSGAKSTPASTSRSSRR